MKKLVLVSLLLAMVAMPARGEIRSIDISIFGMD
jgi:hypothetical protein